MRLRQLRERHPGRVELVHRAFILVPDGQRRTFTPYYLQHRRAAREMTGLPYDLPEVGAPYPISSLRALEAAKWVERHHPEALDAFDLALYEAFFRDTRDISAVDVLRELAEFAGAPPDGMAAALETRALQEAVWADHRAALAARITGIPAVVMGEHVLSGAVPYEDYEQALRMASDGRTAGAARRALPLAGA